MNTGTGSRHLLISTLTSLSLPILIFLIACLVQDISNVKDALKVLAFLLVLAFVLFFSYWILGGIQLRRESPSLAICAWYGAVFSVVMTLSLGFIAYLNGVVSISLAGVTIVVFLLLWLIHLTGSVMQYSIMCSK